MIRLRHSNRVCEGFGRLQAACSDYMVFAARERRRRRSRRRHKGTPEVEMHLQYWCRTDKWAY